MLKKRIIFITAVLLIAIGSFFWLNRKYDKLGRYPYPLSKEEHDRIISILDDQRIEYLIEYAIAPENFMDYLNCRNFNVYFLDSYKKIRDNVPGIDSQSVVSFVHVLTSHFEKKVDADICRKLLDSYFVSEIVDFYNDYPNAGDLIIDAGNYGTMVDLNNSVGYYYPKDLEIVETGYETREILLRKDAKEAFMKMIEDMEKQVKMQNFHIVNGFLSYKELEEINKDYYPGTSSCQLGLSVNLDYEADSPEAFWLKENCEKYGFKEDTEKNYRFFGHSFSYMYERVNGAAQ